MARAGTGGGERCKPSVRSVHRSAWGWCGAVGGELVVLPVPRESFFQGAWGRLSFPKKAPPKSPRPARVRNEEMAVGLGRLGLGSPEHRKRRAGADAPAQRLPHGPALIGARQRPPLLTHVFSLHIMA
jgi:hypothetical protein